MNKKIFVLPILIFLITGACKYTKKKTPLKLRDFYFYTLEKGKEKKIVKDEFTQGEKTFVKILVEDFGYEKSEKGYRISVMEFLKIKTMDGSVVYAKKEVDQNIYLEQLPAYLTFINTIIFKKNMPTGDYNLVFEIIDRIKGLKLKIRKKIHIKGII